MDGNKSDLLLVVRELTEATNRLHADTTKLREEIKVSRQRERLLALSLLLDLVLSLALGVVGLQAKSASDEARSATSAAAQEQNRLTLLCESGNESRRREKQLWEGVIQISNEGRPAPATNDEMVAREERLNRFRALMDEAFPQRDCKTTEEVK